jgi:hypothetical protein
MIFHELVPLWDFLRETLTQNRRHSHYTSNYSTHVTSTVMLFSELCALFRDCLTTSKQNSIVHFHKAKL